MTKTKRQAKMKFAIFLIFILFFSCTEEEKLDYATPTTPWAEYLGNHRAMLQVDKPADLVELDILWRRHDRNPETKKFIIVHERGDTIQNIKRIQVDNEICHLVFGPVEESGKYFFYYLPYEIQKNYGFYNKDYLKQENSPNKDWLKKTENLSEIPKAKLLEFHSRTNFDRFYPMEVIALKAEKDSLIKMHNDDFLVFPEDRKFPIRMLDDIPLKWIKNGPVNEFIGDAQKNEYYTFQLGIFATQKDIKDLQVEFSPLKNGDAEIPNSKLTCFNTGGIGPYGKPFVKRLDLDSGRVQPLWIGVDIPEEI